MYNQLLEHTVNELTYRDFRKKNSNITRLWPTYYDRVRKVAGNGGVRLVGMKPNMWHFTITSGTKVGVKYDNYIQFLNLKSLILDYIKTDVEVWNSTHTDVDYKKLANKILANVDLKTYCSCPSDLFHGFHFIRTRDNAKYTRPENRPPDITNPKQIGQTCVDERAKVLMADGTYKLIKDVKVGEYVITHLGNVKRVTDTFENYTNEIYNVKIDGVLGEFGITGDHECFVKVKNVINKKVEVLVHNKGIIGLYDEKRGNDWVEFKDLDKYSLMNCPKINFGNVYQFNSDLARLLGYYIAEGSMKSRRTKVISDHSYINKKGNLVRGTNILFTIANEELNTIGKDIKEIVFNHFGIVPKVRQVNYNNGKKHSTYTTIEFNGGVNFLKFFGKYIGFGSNKKLSDEVLRFNDEAKYNFLLGLYVGDGCISSNKTGPYNQFILVTSREDLAYQVHSMFLSLGIYNNIKQYKSRCTTNDFIGKRFFVSVILDILPKLFIDKLKKLKKLNANSIRESKLNLHQYRYIDNYICRRIESNVPEQKVVKVYNIEVEDDQSYIVNGVALHNCKHGQLLLEVIMMYASTFSSFLKKYYSVEIEKTKDRFLASLQKESPKELKGSTKKKEVKPVGQDKEDVTKNKKSVDDVKFSEPKDTGDEETEEDDKMKDNGEF